VAEKPLNAWRTTMKRRLAVTATAFGLWAGVIEARLLYLQVVRYDFLIDQAEVQQLSRKVIPGKRGEILDRRGHVLAVSVEAPALFANPRLIDDPARAVAKLCGALRDCSPEDRRVLQARFGNKETYFAYVKRRASADQAERVLALELPGVGVEYQPRRYYPNKELAAHVLGYVGSEGQGLAGIEHTYDEWIKGEDGVVIVQNDARQSSFSSRIEKKPTTGATLELTLDEYLQHIAERELREGVEENRASAGSAVVMDPWTGEILALANYPTFNPHAFNAAPEAALRNRAVQDLYEPGSTFKIVTVAAALEQSIVEPDDMIDVSGGRISFGADTIRDTHDYGVLPFSDAFAKSSNVGAIKVALKLGPERMIEYARRFGFGRHASRRDFPAETPGFVWDASTLIDMELARVSIGYQVSVTPLQMAAAVSSIANGGELNQPRVVRAVIEDGTRRVVTKHVVRRTVRPDVAAQMVAMMEGVVEHGTATVARIPGYTVAGKTGTASKWVDKRYSRTEYNASFVGFVPSRKPVYAIVVVIDSPRSSKGFYGGPVSGPIFKRIAEAALRYGGVPPTLNAPPPLLVDRRPDTGEGPAAVSYASRPAAAARTNGAAAEGLVPDLTGLSAREAVMVLNQLGLQPRMHGTGLVIHQRPAAGTPLMAGRHATLWLDRRAPVVRTSSIAEP
jgi:cell division protein FtsI (penicillin-binding protein 3)